MQGASEYIEIIEKEKYEPFEWEMTVIHFIAFPSMLYNALWWTNVHLHMFIRPVGSQERFKMIFAQNIPYAPQKHYYKNEKDKLHFTLYFQALPKGTTHIDIIEIEGGHPMECFNYFNVPVERISREPIKHCY